MKLILGFMLPMLLGLLFQQFYNMVDTIVVGQFLGVNALAGVGSTGSVNFLVLGFCMGVCAGFAIPVACLLYTSDAADDTGYKLCKDGSPACTGYAHIKHQNEQQIKTDIEYA